MQTTYIQLVDTIDNGLVGGQISIVLSHVYELWNH